MEETILREVNKYLPAHATLLYVCEYGSRNYGIELPDSDHDVFAVYLSPLEFYLRTNSKEDNPKKVYDIKSPDHVDITIVYIDIRHVIDRLGSESCSYIELLFSNVVYFTHPMYDVQQLQHVICEKYSMVRVLKHWLNMYKTYMVQSKYSPRKRYINGIRCLLSADLIEHHQWPSCSVVEMIYSCMSAKTGRLYLDYIDNQDPMAMPSQALLENLSLRYGALKELISRLPEQRRFSPLPLSHLFFDILYKFYGVNLNKELAIQEWPKNDPNNSDQNNVKQE